MPKPTSASRKTASRSERGERRRGRPQRREVETTRHARASSRKRHAAGTPSPTWVITQVDEAGPARLVALVIVADHQEERDERHQLPGEQKARRPRRPGRRGSSPPGTRPAARRSRRAAAAVAVLASVAGGVAGVEVAQAVDGGRYCRYRDDQQEEGGQRIEAKRASARTGRSTSRSAATPRHAAAPRGRPGAAEPAEPDQPGRQRPGGGRRRIPGDDAAREART